MLELKNRLQKELTDLKSMHRFRQLVPSVGHDFCSNDYLGLARHEKISLAFNQVLSSNGYGAASSRFIRGEHKNYHLLEKRLAQFSGFDDALIFSSGYQANIGALSALIKKGDVVFSDRLNHASIIDGLKLSGAHIIIFDHLDLDDLQEKIKTAHAQGCKFLITESLFSMDGDFAPLDKYASLALACDLALIVDESHAMGLYGPHGSGLIDHYGLQKQTLLSISGLGKAFGCFGGFVAADELTIEYLKQKARTLMYSTALPMVALLAIDQALDLVIAGAHLRQKLFSNIAYLLQSLSLEKTGPLLSPILPFIIGDSEKTLLAALKLKERGFDLKAIRPPTVPQGSSRLRLSIHADHEPELLKSLAQTLKDIL